MHIQEPFTLFGSVDHTCSSRHTITRLWRVRANRYVRPYLASTSVPVSRQCRPEGLVPLPKCTSAEAGVRTMNLRLTQLRDTEASAQWRSEDPAKVRRVLGASQVWELDLNRLVEHLRRCQQVVYAFVSIPETFRSSYTRIAVAPSFRASP